tara:strand:- start:157 stop:498 length:342 start_codon:yes stop_codon:yes gene_type:complete
MISTHSWDLDINQMSVSEMQTTFELCLEQFNLLEKHSIESSTVQHFINAVAEEYLDVPYHNFYHGFHVFHSVHCILKDKTIGYIASHQVSEPCDRKVPNSVRNYYSWLLPLLN